MGQDGRWPRVLFAMLLAGPRSYIRASPLLLSRCRNPRYRHVRLGAYLVEKVHELMSSKSIRLDNAAPIWIQRYRPFVFWPNAITPVVFICKAAARPAHVRNFYGFKSSYNVVADAARIRDGRIWPNPNTLINAMAEMLGELPK